MLELKNISIQMPHQQLRTDYICFSHGTISAITGKSGCGKTTLLRYIMGEIEGKGNLLYNDELIESTQRDDFLFSYVSYIDQTGSCFDNMTIYQHFQFYAKIHGRKINQNEILNYLKMVRLKNIDIQKYLSQLSTGERKRVLIAVALMNNKDIIIFDEPMASLDEKNRQEMLNIFQDLRQQGKIIILTTHESESLKICDYQYHIEDGQISQLSCKPSKTISNHTKQEYHKIKYLPYKNIKLKTIFIILMIVGSITCTLLSACTSLTYTSVYLKNKTYQKYENNILFFEKSDDLLESNVLLFDNDGKNALTEEEKREILDIEHVKAIEPLYTLSCLKNSDGTHISVYKDNIKQEDAYFSYEFSDGRKASLTIQVVGYDDKENGYKDHKVYINQMLYDALPIDSLEKISLELTRINSYNNKWTAPFQVNVDEVLTIEREEFTYNPCIYVPKDMIIEYLKDNDILYTPSVYQIFVDPLYDEDVQLNIEKISDYYCISNKQLTQKHILSQAQKQMNTTIRMNFIISSLLSLAFVGLFIYEINIRKKEIKKLSLEGLKKYIRKYYREDSLWISIVSFVVSFLVLLLYGNVLIMSFQTPAFPFRVIWIVTSFLSMFIFMGIKDLYIYRLIKKG